MTACEAISILGDKVANGITACTAEWDVIEEAIQNEYLKFVDQLDPDCEYDIWCYAWLCSWPASVYKIYFSN